MKTIIMGRGYKISLETSEGEFDIFCDPPSCCSKTTLPLFLRHWIRMFEGRAVKNVEVYNIILSGPVYPEEQGVSK